MMNLRPGMRVLDVGCGVGGPAREIARFSDANIIGLNNNDFQIGRARNYTEKAGLSDQVQFVKGDFMKLSEQFGENSFDAGEYVREPILYHDAHCDCSICYRGNCTCSYVGGSVW
jgi:cyclopropane fatty-acyl-phospholipid synthase-like methyltransferase